MLRWFGVKLVCKVGIKIVKGVLFRIGCLSWLIIGSVLGSLIWRILFFIVCMRDVLWLVSWLVLFYYLVDNIGGYDLFDDYLWYCGE